MHTMAEADVKVHVVLLVILCSRIFPTDPPGSTGRRSRSIGRRDLQELYLDLLVSMPWKLLIADLPGITATVIAAGVCSLSILRGRADRQLMEIPRVGRKWGMVTSSALMGVALALVSLPNRGMVMLMGSINS